MSVVKSIQAAWRKNASDISGLWDGSFPDFVTALRPKEILAGVPVFCYHVVEERRLRGDLRFLRTNGYHTLSGDEFLAHLKGERAIPPRSVLLTFDDGPRNFYDVAFPLLRGFHARAIHFIAPGLHAERGAKDMALSERPMNWDELREIHASGLVQFQSHTYESRYVPRWPDIAVLAGCLYEIEESRRARPLDLRQDLLKARETIEAQLPGATANHLSFPMYVGTPAAVELARSLDIQACYWGQIPRRALNRAGDSPYFISRISDEYLRRLPGEGRSSIADMVKERAHRIRLAREWRRRYGAGPAPAQQQASG